MMVRKSIFVVSHKNVRMPSENIYVPMQVGYSPYNFSGYVRDNTGNNISEKNKNYCELTAQYWIWKNCKDLIKGLVHYRRLFSNGSYHFLDSINKRYNDVLSESTLEKILSEHDIILPKKHNYYIETAYEHYAHNHHTEGLRITYSVLKYINIDYAKKFNDILQRRSSHLFNMFIAHSEIFDNYSSWLFEILNKVEELLDISEYSVNEARVFGYISELLIDVFVENNFLKYYELPVMFMEKQNYLIKYSKGLYKKLGFYKVK